MLVQLYIFFELVMIVLMLLAFFTKQEILWAMALILAGVLMVTSFDVEVPTYEFNDTTLGYAPITMHYSYPYLMGINMLFFFIGVTLSIFDIWDKYGSRLGGNYGPPKDDKR